MKSKRQKLRLALDKAWATKVKQGGRCEHCGKTSPLNAHHFYSRSSLNTRWDLDNGFCLCVGCHVFSSKFSAHKTPAEFVEWATELRGVKWYYEMKLKHLVTVHWKIYDLEDKLEELK